LSTDEQPSYQAYLLRCWQEEGSAWRFRLQDLRTGEQTGFSDLEALLDHLRGLMDEADS
jgi:hypothetical protein